MRKQKFREMWGLSKNMTVCGSSFKSLASNCCTVPYLNQRVYTLKGKKKMYLFVFSSGLRKNMKQLFVIVQRLCLKIYWFGIFTNKKAWMLLLDK